MMTQLEQRFMQLGVAYFANNSNVDWEQRRYEIAKDFMCACASRIGNSRSDLDGYVNSAVAYADKLIEKLQTTKQ